MENMQTETSEKVVNFHFIPSRFTPIFVGMIAGLFTASVLFNKIFPSWMPFVFSEYPFLFFGLFIVVFGCFGYIWALADDHSPEEKITEYTHPQMINSVITGIVCGLFGAAVLYEKTLPAWVPQFLADNPIAFFGLFIVVCGSLGYTWTLPEDE